MLCNEGTIVMRVFSGDASPQSSGGFAAVMMMKKEFNKKENVDRVGFGVV